MNIFDTNNIDDLPINIKNDFHKLKKYRMQKMVELIDLATTPVTTNQIMVAFYRKYNVCLSKNNVNNILLRLKELSLITQVSKGVYCPVKKSNII